MKITSEKLEISPSNVINWADVYELHYSKERVIVRLTGNKSVEIGNLSPLMVDRIFREYENYLSLHGKKKDS